MSLVLVNPAISRILSLWTLRGPDSSLSEKKYQSIFILIFVPWVFGKRQLSHVIFIFYETIHKLIFYDGSLSRINRALWTFYRCRYSSEKFWQIAYHYCMWTVFVFKCSQASELRFLIQYNLLLGAVHKRRCPTIHTEYMNIVCPVWAGRHTTNSLKLKVVDLEFPNIRAGDYNGSFVLVFFFYESSACCNTGSHPETRLPIFLL